MENMKILFTGGSGFIGRNIIPQLSERYHITAPSRAELDLKNEKEVQNFIKKNDIDIVIHSANPNPTKNTLDRKEEMLQDSLRIFFNFYNARSYYRKLLIFGSGAEYDKSRAISMAKEEEIGESIPKDVYGFAKYIINEIARKSENIYNLRLFGCYGPTDHESKFPTHTIRCCMEGKEITIRQDCFFDYMHVYDLIGILPFFIERTPKFHDYNVCSGKRIKLSEIAEITKTQMGSERYIKILASGMNNEYTGSNKRLLDEIGTDFKFTSMEKGIGIQIESEKMK